MSKANNLKDFLADVADAIRAKKGSTALINPQDFSSEIASLSGGLEIVEMSETTATIEPNKVYVWGMVESLDITLGASTDENDFFAFRFRCSKPTMTVVTINGATWAADTELDAQGKPVLDLGSWYQCEIKGGTSALYARLAHYIPFADSNVEAVLLAKGVGDGLGVTYKDAAKVKSISTWFMDNADITAFDEFAAFTGITYLERFAFHNCSNLQRLKLPSSLMGFAGNAVFGNCSMIEEITIPSSFTNFAKNGFNGCTKLTKVKGLENTQITIIDEGSFQNCSSLAEINFPSSLKQIGAYAFYGCSSLLELNIPTDVSNLKIWNLAFFDCQSLSVINIISAISYLGRGAFSGVQLSGVVNFENLTEIGAYALRYTNVTKVIFPAIITLPALFNNDGIFSDCSHLVLVDIGENCTDIGDRSLGRYVGTQGIDITLIVRASTPPSLGGSLIGIVSANIGSIFVPDASVEAYKQATNWSLYTDVIKPLSEYTE